MKSIKIGNEEITKVLGVSIEDLEAVYNEAVKEATEFWAENALQFPEKSELAPLVADLNIFNGEAYSHIGAEFAAYRYNGWQEGVTSTTILDGSFEFANALDWTFDEFGDIDEDVYSSPEVTAYLEKCQAEFVKNYPLEFKYFDDVVAELVGIDEYLR